MTKTKKTDKDRIVSLKLWSDTSEASEIVKRLSSGRLGLLAFRTSLQFGALLHHFGHDDATHQHAISVSGSCHDSNVINGISP